MCGRAYFKVRLSLSKRICLICLIESPLEIMKNASYFILKALLVLKIFCFLSRLFGHLEKNGLIRRRLTSESKTSQPGLRTVTIHILLNISESKDNQTMKFGQLIEYYKRNIFLQKLCEKWGRETSPRPLFIFLESLMWGESKWSAA